MSLMQGVTEITEHEKAERFTAALASERARLVRLCARLSGSNAAAEDLVQETLLEAWRAREKLSDVEAIMPWLSAIARNVCHRHLRRQSRDRAHLLHGDATFDLAESVADATSFSLAIEDAEVAAVLGRALAALPATTRHALEAIYLREQPQAEVARELQMSKTALRVRLHRGKVAMRQALTSTLREDAIAVGLELPEATGWQATRIWCPWCGRHHLEWMLDRASGRFAFRCMGACEASIYQIASGLLPDGLTSPKVILSRVCLNLGDEYRRALSTESATCPFCGRPVHIVWLGEDDSIEAPNSVQMLLFTCDRCATLGGASPWHLALDTAEAQRFWRRNPRMRIVPSQEVEYDGRSALLTVFENTESTARLRLVSARATHEILHVAGDGM
jgi:RNA polymerase sigma factor (sigma-70 family)